MACTETHLSSCYFCLILKGFSVNSKNLMIVGDEIFLLLLFTVARGSARTILPAQETLTKKQTAQF